MKIIFVFSYLTSLPLHTVVTVIVQTFTGHIIWNYFSLTISQLLSSARCSGMRGENEFENKFFVGRKCSFFVSCQPTGRRFMMDHPQLCKFYSTAVAPRFSSIFILQNHTCFKWNGVYKKDMILSSILCQLKSSSGLKPS